MLERLIASVCRASSKVATISSKVHRVTVTILVLGQSAGHRDHVDPRGSGNDSRAPRASGILQTRLSPGPGSAVAICLP